MAPTTRQTANSQDTVNNQPTNPIVQSDQEIIAQLRAQVEALTAILPTPEDPVAPTIERDTPATVTTISEYSGPAKYSKKRPDPPIFTNGADPTFESWKIQMQAKLRDVYITTVPDLLDDGGYKNLRLLSIALLGLIIAVVIK